MSEPTTLPAVAASTASQKLIQCWLAAKPENSRVTSLGTGMHALSGTISANTPRSPNRAMMPVTVFGADGAARATAGRADGEAEAVARRGRVAAAGGSRPMTERWTDATVR